MKCTSLDFLSLVAMAAVVPDAGVSAGPPPYGEPISLAVAKKIAAGAVDEAKKNNWNMVVAITDGGGHLVYLERQDSTHAGSVEVALAKARSSALFRNPTRVFADHIAKGGIGNRFMVLPGALPVGGGLPIVIDGKLIGAIGVSGGTMAQDEQAAAAGLAAIP